MIMIMLNRLTAFLRLIRFSHTVFALPFALIAACLAANAGQAGLPTTGRLVLVVAAMAFARSAAMGFNRIVDLRFDALNPRTNRRELVTGRILRPQAIAFTATAALLFLATTTLFYLPIGPCFGYRNPYPLLLAAPVLAFLCAYSYTKRFTWACHFWLAPSLMLAPLAAWIAVAPPQGPFLAPAPLVLAGAVLFWVAGFDIIYATQDVHFDRQHHLCSVPANLGLPTARLLCRTCHSLTLAALLLLPFVAPLGRLYLAGVTLTALLLITEHILVAKNRLQLAFNLNGPISLLLAAAALADILLHNHP